MADESARTWAAEQSADTRRQLILSAMRLMADRGIGGVSLRSVNAEAGARNSSAAHYHFGDKMGLVEAVVDFLAAQEAEWRAPVMQRLRARAVSETITVRDAVESAYLPFYGFFYHPEYRISAIKFLSRLIVDTEPDMRVLANRFIEPLARDAYDAIAPLLPEIPEKLLKSRIQFSMINLINGGSDAFAMSYSAFGDLSYENPFELASHFMDYLVAGISAPVGVLDERFSAFCTDLVKTTQSTDAGSPGEASAD